MGIDLAAVSVKLLMIVIIGYFAQTIKRMIAVAG